MRSIKTANRKKISYVLYRRGKKDFAGLRKSHPLYIRSISLPRDVAGIFTSHNRDTHSFGCSKNAVSRPVSRFVPSSPVRKCAHLHSSRNSSNSSNSEMHSVTLNVLARI